MKCSCIRASSVSCGNIPSGVLPSRKQTQISRLKSAFKLYNFRLSQNGKLNRSFAAANLVFQIRRRLRRPKFFRRRQKFGVSEYSAATRKTKTGLPQVAGSSPKWKLTAWADCQFPINNWWCRLAVSHCTSVVVEEVHTNQCRPTCRWASARVCRRQFSVVVQVVRCLKGLEVDWTGA